MEVRSALTAVAMLALMGCQSTGTSTPSSNKQMDRYQAKQQQYEKLEPLDLLNLPKPAADQPLSIEAGNLLGRWKCTEKLGQLTAQSFALDGYYELDADGRYRQKLSFDHNSLMYGHIPLSFTITGTWTMRTNHIRFEPVSFKMDQRHPEPWEELYVLPPKAQQQLKQTILQPWDEQVSQLSQQSITFIDNNGESSLCKRSAAI